MQYPDDDEFPEWDFIDEIRNKEYCKRSCELQPASS